MRKVNIKEMFGKELKELKFLTNDTSLIEAIDKELAERFDTLNAMDSAIGYKF